MISGKNHRPITSHIKSHRILFFLEQQEHRLTPGQRGTVRGHNMGPAQQDSRRRGRAHPVAVSRNGAPFRDTCCAAPPVSRALPVVFYSSLSERLVQRYTGGVWGSNGTNPAHQLCVRRNAARLWAPAGATAHRLAGSSMVASGECV